MGTLVGGASSSLAQQTAANAEIKPRRGAQHVVLESALLHAQTTPLGSPASAAASDVQPGAATPLPPNVTELTFNDFFKTPVGDCGLELTDTLRGLDGKIVRITGYMINHVHANPRVFILSPVPLTFHQCEYGLCDDLPAASVHVKVGGTPRERIPYIPGLLTFTGRLSVGPREELDGRISNARLLIDPAAVTELLHTTNPPGVEPSREPGTAEGNVAANRGTPARTDATR